MHSIDVSVDKRYCDEVILDSSDSNIVDKSLPTMEGTLTVSGLNGRSRFVLLLETRK